MIISAYILTCAALGFAASEIALSKGGNSISAFWIGALFGPIGVLAVYIKN